MIHQADCLPRFVSIYNSLNAERGWWSEASSLRFAAMIAIACPGSAEEVAKAIRRIAGEIQKRSGWFGQLNSSLRFIVSAMLVLQDDDPGLFVEEVERVKDFFRSLNLRRGGIYETMAILILRQKATKQPIEKQTVERFQAMYEEMKRHHWWLTGPEDFPVCAMLVGEKGPREIGEAVERIFQELNRQGFSAGDCLQTAANILYLARLDPEVAAKRYSELAQGFREKGVAIWKSDYDELAILSFLDHPAGRIVDQVLDRRKEMESLNPRPDRSLTFNLAAGIVFLEMVGVDRDLKNITDVKALMDMQAIINAQHAAAMAAASSAAAAG